MNNTTEKVLEYFKELCNIPRPSGHEEMVREYLRKWASDNGYTYVIDNAGNLIVECLAKPGYENKPLIILQSHMDMVCVSEPDVNYNPLTDKIVPVIQGDYLKAESTSLGGDDGVGIAISQYIADFAQERGALRLIFTVDEEDTTCGAVNLDEKFLEAPYLINLDSEVSDKIMISSAGCVELFAEKNVRKVVTEGCCGVEIILKGLAGGHSGDDINKNRENGIVVAGRLIQVMNDDKCFELVSINGGDASNAIPAGCVIRGNTSDIEAIKKTAQIWQEKIKNENPNEKEFIVEVKQEALYENVIGKQDTDEIVKILTGIHNGIAKMSESIEDMVTLSSNLGKVSVNGDSIRLEFLLRGEIEGELVSLSKEMKRALHNAKFEVASSELTPSWPADNDSVLLKLVQDAYLDVTGENAEAIAVHAVLECAEFRRKNKTIDMVSFSPDVYDVHSAKERLFIPSIKKCVDVIEKVLKEIN